MEASDMTLIELCNSSGVEISSELLGVKVDAKQWEHREWQVTLTYQKRKLTTTYNTGMGIKGEPSAADLVYSLCSDARVGDVTFEEFCADYGYDADSRRAESIYKACCAIGPKIRRLLGADFEVFANAEH